MQSPTADRLHRGVSRAKALRESRSERRRGCGAVAAVPAAGPPRSTPPDRSASRRRDPAAAVEARRSRLRSRIHEATMSVTMAKVKLDPRDPLDLNEQVAAEIRRAIADGEAKPGERLPPAKD